MAQQSATKRRMALAVVIGGAGLIAARLVSLAEEHGDTAAPASEPRVRSGDREPRPAAAAPAELQLARLDALRGTAAQEQDPSATSDQPSSSLFSPRSWQPPAPPPPKPPPPPPPTAPAFPYKYFGGMTDAGTRTAYFTNGGRVLALRVGDVVDSRYRVDAIDNQHISMTYLPLEQSLQIQLGGSP